MVHANEEPQVSIIFILPTIRPVTADNMNYAIVFLAFILLCAMVYWYINGRKFYTGPLVEAEIGDVEVDSASSGADHDKKEGDLTHRPQSMLADVNREV